MSSPNPESAGGYGLRPPLGGTDSPLNLQRARWREQFPLLWESLRMGRPGILQQELRLFLSSLHDLHAVLRLKEEKAFDEARRQLDQWRRREDAWHRALPELAARLSALFPGLEREMGIETSPEIRSQLSFSLGGLQRLASLPPAPENGAPVRPFPSGPDFNDGGEAVVTKALLGLRVHATDTPTQFLGRLEAICADWWFSHQSLFDLYSRCVGDVVRMASLTRKSVRERIAHRILPVIDALDACLQLGTAGSTAPQNAHAARLALLAFLAKAEVTPMETRVGDGFDPRLHHAGRSRLSGPPARLRVSKVLRTGYGTGDGVIRPAEVELIRG